MRTTVSSKADLEYAVMLAVLDFQTEFMKSNYTHVHTHISDEVIYVTSTRSASIPAEKELARSPEGHDLLRRFHRALFDSCQHILRTRIEQAIGANIQHIVADLDPAIGLSTIVIKLHSQSLNQQPINLS